MKQTVTAFWQTRNAKGFDAGANSSGRMEALRRIATLAQPALSQAGTTSIDLGCGTGLFAAIVGMRSLIGVDVSEALLVAARERMDTVVHQVEAPSTPPAILRWASSHHTLWTTARNTPRHMGWVGCSGMREKEHAMGGMVEAVHRSASHTLIKPGQLSIRLLARLGVESDAHMGTTVQHRSRVARDPSQPNLRQVHLIHAELHDELRAGGFPVHAGEMGENITTRGVDLLRLPVGTRLHLGVAAVVEITGLRNPCAQLDRLQPGLLAAVLDHDAQGHVVRKAGVMGVVLAGGEVRPDDPIRVELPPEPHQSLQPV